MFEEVYSTLKEANKAADKAWSHLTLREQKQRHIYVATVTEADLTDDAVDEDGNVDWLMYKQCDVDDGAFDSDKLQ